MIVLTPARLGVLRPIFCSKGCVVVGGELSKWENTGERVRRATMYGVCMFHRAEAACMQLSEQRT